MKSFRFIIATLFIAAAFAASAFAQTPTGRVGLINTLAFEDPKAGIGKYTTALKSVETEFQKELNELTALANRIQTLEKELTGLQTQLTSTNAAVPVNKEQLQTTYATKADEYGKLGREFKFKQDDTKARFERRRQVVVGPILMDIGRAMNEYAKSKGYTMLLDGAKLEEAGVLLAFDEKSDVTKDFITFYNARPATSAVTTPVK